MYEAMVYPSHMLRRKTAGDVTFGFNDRFGIHVNKITYRDPDGRVIPKSFVVKFVRGGSGFVIKKLPHAISIGTGYIIGIIITAGHVVCDTSSHIPDYKSFSCKIDDKDFEAIFFKSFMKEHTEPMLSFTSKNFFIYSGDIALLFLFSKKKVKLTQLEISRPNEINIDSDIVIMGYPVKPEDISYCCPVLRADEGDERDKLINEAFHNFEHLVYSRGHIVGKSEAIIDINCASTNGMSGGPIVANNKIVGVYLGGPPLPGQYQLYCVNQLVRANRFAEAFSALRAIQGSIAKFYRKIEYVEELERILFICAITSVKIKGVAENNNIPEFLEGEGRVQREIDVILKDFFEERLIVLYNSLISERTSEFHSMGANLYRKKEDFIMVYDYINKILGNTSLQNESIRELQMRVSMLVIGECQILTKSPIPLRVLEDPRFYEILTRYEELKEEFFFLTLKRAITRFDLTYSNAVHDMVIQYDVPEELKHNIAMSASHPIFQQVKQILDDISRIQHFSFESTDVFFHYLHRKNIY